MRASIKAAGYQGVRECLPPRDVNSRMGICTARRTYPGDDDYTE